MLSVDTILNWPFSSEPRSYDHRDSRRYAEGFGAGVAGALQQADQCYLAGPNQQALPMMAVPLADGEFWQQNPATGIVWQQMLHAAEAITVHRPLPVAGELTLSQKVEQLLDRGVERGAVMIQRQTLSDQAGALVDIDVTTVLRGNGGFGGPPDQRPRERWVPDDRPADAAVDVLTPRGPNALFALNAELAVAAKGATDQAVLRGVGCFGLAGRAALYLLCNNQPQRLRHFAVRYAGVMLTGETMRVEVWRLAKGRAALRMSALERAKPVLDHCLVEFNAD